MSDVFQQETIWIDIEGNELRIVDMSTSHLQNVIAYLHRHADAIYARDLHDSMAMVTSLQGEMATYYAEQDVDRMITMSPATYIDEFPVVEAMRGELERRGVKQ